MSGGHVYSVGGGIVNTGVNSGANGDQYTHVVEAGQDTMSNASGDQEADEGAGPGVQTNSVPTTAQKRARGTKIPSKKGGMQGGEPIVNPAATPERPANWSTMSRAQKNNWFQRKLG